MSKNTSPAKIDPGGVPYSSAAFGRDSLPIIERDGDEDSKVSDINMNAYSPSCSILLSPCRCVSFGCF